MKNTWVVSDTHFGHENILKFEDGFGNRIRPEFSSVEEMNEHMIERWNAVVRPGDKVYHLGDVIMGKDKLAWMNKNWPRLAGKKNLIVGNHDSIKELSAGGWFANVYMWRKLSELNLLLTHVPVHESTLHENSRSGIKLKNVHGHIHQNAAPSEAHRCVCVEHTSYTPINIEELVQWAAA
jgi:calcineurin-like phosphoesterase family protein